MTAARIKTYHSVSAMMMTGAMTPKIEGETWRVGARSQKLWMRMSEGGLSNG